MIENRLFLCETSVYNISSIETFIDMETGEVGCVKTIGITESFHLKRQVLLSASEAAEMIIRVDDILKAAPRQRGRDMRHH